MFGQAVHLIPSMRTSGIVMTEAGTDVLVYDADTHALHTLNQTVVSVWNACDGKQTVATLGELTGLDTEAVQQALSQLAAANLLDGALPSSVAPAQSRRAFMKKAAVAGAVAVPAIVSVTASTAAQSASCPSSCSAHALNIWCPNEETCGICIATEVTGFGQWNGFCLGAVLNQRSASSPEEQALAAYCELAANADPDGYQEYCS